jgi:hypothetical protein
MVIGCRLQQVFEASRFASSSLGGGAVELPSSARLGNSSLGVEVCKERGLRSAPSAQQLATPQVDHSTTLEILDCPGDLSFLSPRASRIVGLDAFLTV